MSAVLGYSWLSDYNPLIDWKKRSIHFRTAPATRPVSDPVPQASPMAPPEPTPPTPTSDAPKSVPQVSVVNAAAFARACRLPGSESFTLNLSATSVLGRATSVSGTPPDLSGIPPEYHEFADVFSKTKADILLENCLHDLKIILEDGATPPLGPIYSLSKTELNTLCKYIDKNLRSGFIRPLNSPCGAPILFIKKKDRSLRPVQDYRKLNEMTVKNRYPLPLIQELVDKLKQSRYFTKMDVRWGYNNI